MPRGALVAEQTRNTVRVGPLEVDRTPVTNARYARFVAETGHRPPLYWPNGRCPGSLVDHPVVGVDFFDAVAFALWAGGRLPTELEWCLATGLEEHRAYVWGDLFDARRCNTATSGPKGTTPVGTYPEGVAPSGCIDMHGNVWELTCTPYPGDDECVIVKGGSWYDYPAHAKIDVRFRSRVHKGSSTIGFRLVYGGELRLPDFLDADLVAHCIAYRRGAPRLAPLVEPAPEEFEDLFDTLREQAASHIPALEIEQEQALDLDAVEEALALFDAAESGVALRARSAEAEPDGITKAKRVAYALHRVVRTMQRAFAERPRTMLLFLGLAFAAVLGISVAATSEETPSLRAAPVEPPVLRVIDRVRANRIEGAAPRTERPERERRAEPSRPVQRNLDLPPLERALQDVVHGSPAVREEAERWLIWHSDQARDQIRQQLELDLPAHARSSLRYVEEAVREEEAERIPEPRRVRARPRHGLVYVLDRMDSFVDEELTKIRRTAKAEGVRLTVVIVGRGEADLIARDFAHLFRDVDLFIDRDGELRQELKLARLPGLAGLRRDGRTAFVLAGRVPRHRLLSQIGRLGE